MDCKTTWALNKNYDSLAYIALEVLSPWPPFSIGWFLSFTIIHSRGRNHHPKSSSKRTLFTHHFRCKFVAVPTSTVSPEVPSHLAPLLLRRSFDQPFGMGALPSYMGIVSKDPHASQYFMELSRFERTLLFNRINVTFRWQKLHKRWMMVIFQKKLEEIVGFEGRKSQQEIQQMPGA